MSIGPGLDYMSELLPYAIVGTALFVVLLIFNHIWKRVVSRNVSGAGIEVGMSFTDLDRMRKQGLINEEEYRRLRQSLANRELERSREKDQFEKERLIISQIERNPELARELLPPEALAKSKSPTSAPAPPAAAPGSPEIPTSQGRRAADRPAAFAQPTVTLPATPNPAPPSASPQPPRDLDMLLEKGIITPEQYEKLKKALG